MDKVKEKLLFETAERFFNSEIDSMKDFCSRDLIVLGTSIDEEVYSLKGFQDYRRKIKATKKDVKIKKIRKLIFHKITSGGNGALLIYEVKSNYISADIETSIYQRVTMGIEFKNDKWEIVHVHFSRVNEDQEEDDPFHFSEIKKKNEELQKSVEEKTADLMKKNRDLEIEASLERVRTVSMSMKNPDDLLDICEILFKELHSLGFMELRNAMINIFNDDKETFVNYDFSDVLGKSITPLFYDIHPIIKKQVKQVRKSKDAYTETVFSIKDLSDWKKFRRSRGEKDDPRLKKAKALHYYFYSVGTAAIGISTFSPVTDEKKQILKRFRNVFDFAYRRYMDVTQAEAQAREAKIEASLERVRARSMAMHHSCELVDASVVLFNELKSLGIEAIRTGVAIVDELNKSLEVWSSQLINKDRNKILGVVPFKAHPFFEKYYESWKNREPFFLYDLSGKDVKKYYNLMSSILSYPKMKEFNPRELFYTVFFPEGSLNVVSKDILTEDECNLMLRFANVFGMIYRRFLDLQKAEAQAREAQIEAALEKVRSRSLAMHKAEELGEVITVVVEKLKELNFTVDDGVALITHIEGSKDLLEWMANPGFPSAIKFYLPYFEHPVLSNLWKAKNEGAEFVAKRYTDKENKSFLKHIFKHSDFKHTPQPIKDYCLAANTYATSIAFQKNTAIFINDYSGKTLTEEEVDILKRLSKVFEQAYIRFLDLQKAEAQAKEAQIEAALERVRSRTMGMQKSEELKDVIQVIYEQFVHLNINIDHAGIIMDYKERDDMNIWVSDHRGNLSQVTFPYFDTEHWNRFNEAKEKGKDFFAVNLTFKEKNIFYKKLFKYIPGLPEEAKEFYFNCPGLAISTVLLDNVSLYIENFSGVSYTDEENATLMRFGKVFQQTYTRFLDLQKAEEQAREAQIQLALERVRARAMAMQKSDELSELVDTVFKELTKLDFALTWCIINIIDEGSMSNTVWAANPEIDKAPESYHMLFEDYPFHHAMMKGWKERKAKYVHIIEGIEKKIYDDYLFSETEFKRTPEAAQAASRAMEKYVVSFSFSNFGGLQTVGEVPLSDANLDILSRFGKVFDLTYTRFNDLKQTEAQARAAQIEAALERVRGKAMAMHNSDDLTEAAGQVFTELNHLGIKPIRSGFVLLSKDSRIAKLYPATSFDSKNTVSFTGEFEFTGHPVYEKQYEIWQKNENYFPVLEGDLLKSYYKILAKGLSVPYENFPTDRKQYGTFLPFSEGFLFTWSDEAYSENEINILDRFKNILDLTIRRYIDLKNAEAQSRESQIEASLERVRSKAMAMQKSEDLNIPIAAIYEELDKLNLGTLRCGIGIIDKEKKSANVWTTAKTEHGTIVQLSRGETIIHPLIQETFDAWLRQEDFSYILRDEDLINFYERVAETNSELPASHSVEPKRKRLLEYYYVTSFSVGNLYAFREKEFPEEAKTVMKRFAEVINFTYTRFNDLKQAEAQAREAKIEAALERVRSRTLAMQKSDELAETAAVLFKQLINLGIEPNRLYIGIINDDSGDIEAWATDEDGSKVSKEFTLNVHANASVKKMYDGWAAKKKSIIIDMHGKELEEYFHYLNDVLNVPFKVGLSHDRRVQNIAYFSKGFIGMSKGYIGMASHDPQPEESAILLERFAAVFNLTFTRFNDLQMAEKHAEQAELDLIKLQTEKKRAEEALTELRSTQAQLIQSEKMASLGELTAGIAHEIQNPLNFVNNFSEVNTELVDELNHELDKGNFEEAVLIAKDIKENEKKIKHHGKRAEGIVKGMLQHSRSSSGVKELVNINVLADEYLRLAYHGLRAKDKTFNAKMETEFDESIGEINVVPQDIGRVILNLITNAFYAVAEKKKGEIKGYEPKVTVSTKKSGENILISVKDNGNGIPQKAMDKIFQPFFTTKPTGQGTGLGLSMSYDIIKAHGGELKAETREREGSEFVISLRIN